VAEMPPKSVIVTPADRQKISAGPVTVSGWAWSGFGPVQTVEVSTDAGRCWQPADLHRGERLGWQRWNMIWDTTPGKHRLQARATDERRLSQPAVAPWNAKGYLMNAIQEILVEVLVES
jgi:sulfane dehydrogenase subunit SoxC